MPVLKIFKCQHCKTRFVIMSTDTNSVLPVEVKDEIYSEEDIFNYRIHKSHLQNCKLRTNDWQIEKRKYMKHNSLRLK